MTALELRRSSSGCLLVAIVMGLLGGCKGGSGALGYPDAISGGGGRRASGGATSIADGGIGGAAGGSLDDGGISDAVGDGTGGAADVGVGTGGGGGSGGGIGSGGTIGTGGSAGPTNVRVLGGPAALISPGQSCSTLATPPGGTTPDQWCGGIRPGTPAGTLTLLVFNLTKAMSGAALTCAPGDPNCLVLSPAISNDAPHGFFGETLVYYDTLSVFAWRPGWTAGRVLLPQDQLANCVAGPGVATAICIKLTTDPAVENLYAGRIDAQTGAPLPLVEPIGTEGSDIGFSTDLESVVWSTKATTTAPEILKIQTIGDAATRRTVATNVTAWSQTPDGLRWLWLSQPLMDVTTGWTMGTLQASPFPAGTSPTDVHSAVVEYAPFAAKGMMVLANPGGLGADLTAITDIDSPTTSARLLQAADVLGFTGLADDGTVLYFDDFIQDAVDPSLLQINLLTSKPDATGKCAVSATPDADYGAVLNRTASRVTWARPNAVGTAYEGVATALPGCSSRTFSTALASFFDVGPGVMVQENFNAQAFTASLGFVPLTSDGSPGAKVVASTVADTVYMPLFPGLPKVVFSVNQTALDSGIYVSRALTGTSAGLLRAMNAVDGTGTSTGAGAFGVEPGTRTLRLSTAVRPAARAALLRHMRLPAAGGVRLSPPARARFARAPK